MTTNSNAPRSGWPTREIALLIADPRPALRTGIEPISVFVRGATMQEIPRPNRMIDGKTSTRKPAVGASVEGWLSDARHGSDVAGILESQSRPTAMMSGPAVRKGRAPILPAIDPTRVDSTVSMTPTGSPMVPAANAV
jgi:hypothetical protein